MDASTVGIKGASELLMRVIRKYRREVFVVPVLSNNSEWYMKRSLQLTRHTFEVRKCACRISRILVNITTFNLPRERSGRLRTK